MKDLREGFAFEQEINAECAELLCRECGNVFTADFDILKPVNVVHDLGHNSATVTCPHCNNTAGNAERDLHIHRLQMLLKVGDIRLNSALETADIKFNSTITDDGKSELECISCGETFSVDDADKEIYNYETATAKATLIGLTCPHCGVSDDINDVKARSRLNVILFDNACSALKMQLAVLESNDIVIDPDPPPGL